MKVDRIEERMEEKHISVKRMALELGMHQSTYYRKRQNNGNEFTVRDLMVFKKVLELSNQEAVDFLLS